MTQSSGLDSLLEALKQSGMDVDGVRGKNTAESRDSHVDARSSSEGKRASSRGSSRGGTTNPFGGFGQLFGFGDAPFGGGKSGGNTPGGGGGNGGGPHAEIINPFAGASEWSKKRIVGLVIIAILILLAAYWWFHPPISINSTDTWAFVSIFILLPAFLIFRTRSRSYETGTSKVDPDQGKSRLFRILSFIPIVIVALGILGGILSLSVIPGNAERYAHVLQTTKLDFAEDIDQVNYAEIPVIDHDSAELLGNREMGIIPEYVSQFEISPLYSQINYQGTPVRVSPLGYADLFKWFTNRSAGIPAYALVDMTTQDAEVVRLGEGNGMKYTQSEPLARNIDRYVQLSYPFYIFDQKSFEIDEDGHPWWICPVRSYTIGLFGGETIERVIMCDAVTGECTDIAVTEVPEWVDRVYPSDLLIRQYNWSGAYINGWFNSWLGQAGVYQTTPGTDGNPGYNYIAKDDDVWVYSGVTSATADNSIIGFVLVNQRTAESHFYSVAGATEDSAMGSAEGQVQHLRYVATFPLLINVANQPTYFMALKDGAGLVKMFAMIDIQRYQNVAVGDTVASCQEAYERLLATNGILTEEDTTAVLNVEETQGTIRTMAQAVIDGTSHFYVMLEGDELIYDFILPDLITIVGYQPGDQIHITYIKGEATQTVQEIIGADGEVESGQLGAVGSDTESTGSGAFEGEATSGSGDDATGGYDATATEPAQAADLPSA